MQLRLLQRKNGQEKVQMQMPRHTPRQKTRRPARRKQNHGVLPTRGDSMKILTEPQANQILTLLFEIEKTSSKPQQILYAERIRAIILQAEQVTVKLEQ
mgnify:CR=1 FL=1